MAFPGAIFTEPRSLETKAFLSLPFRQHSSTYRLIKTFGGYRIHAPSIYGCNLYIIYTALFSPSLMYIHPLSLFLASTSYTYKHILFQLKRPLGSIDINLALSHSQCLYIMSFQTLIHIGISLPFFKVASFLISSLFH